MILKSAIMTEAGHLNYRQRYHVNGDNKVNIVDVMHYRGLISAECA